MALYCHPTELSGARVGESYDILVYVEQAASADRSVTATSSDTNVVVLYPSTVIIQQGASQVHIRATVVGEGQSTLTFSSGADSAQCSVTTEAGLTPVSVPAMLEAVITST